MSTMQDVSPPFAELVHKPLPEAELADAMSEAATGAWRELLTVALLVGLCDATIYLGHGFAGYALLFVVTPLLLLLGAARRPRRGGILIGGLLALLALKTLWLGSTLNVVLGFSLLTAFAMTLAGATPYVLELLVFASQCVPSGYFGLARYYRLSRNLSPSMPQANWLLRVGLPVVTCLAFSGLFLLANPDLMASIHSGLSSLFSNLQDWLLEALPTPLRVVFWCVVGWLAVGFLRSIANGSVDPPPAECRKVSLDGWRSGCSAPAPLFEAFRNTLAAVSLLFAAYLAFEFQTLWLREFPPNFYYPGYAHEGAAWLTVALGLATVILSVVFRGDILQDERLPRLRRLAWLWSFENFLLAIAVYHRLFIYIGFNGLTRMRMVGLFGISAVVLGFGLVLWKIARHHDFLGLVRRQMWALALIVYLFALTPVDSVVVGYNARRILAGDLAPSMQIGAHAINSEGFLLLPPLLKCDDQTIREGVQALLAERLEELEQLSARRQDDWTGFQFADQLLLDRLRANRSAWLAEDDADRRARVLKRFRDYTYQWY